jgi:hypothetical protein
MESNTSTATSQGTTRRGWALVLMAAVLVGGCSSYSAETIHGAWHWPEQGVYESLDAEGNWGVWLSRSLEGDPYDWGTYTFDGETLTYNNAKGSVCSGATAVWTVQFAKGGDEAHQKFVEDSCSSVRGQDRVLIRHSP